MAPRLDILLTLLDALPPVAYWDVELRNLMVNEAFCDYFGVTAEDAHGRHLAQVIWPQLVPIVLPFFERAAEGEPQEFDRVTQDPNGANVYAHVVLTPDIVDGSVRGVVAHTTDITARRQAELQLAFTESQFKLTIMASPVGIAQLRMDGRLTQSNPALATILGRSQEELEGRYLAELIDPNADPDQAQRLADVFVGAPASVTIECDIERPDGSSVAVILNLACTPEGNRDGVIGVLQAQDITERKRAEEAVRRSQRRLEQAEEIAKMGTWEWDLRSGRGIRSAGMLAILKLEPDSAEESIEETLRRVHGDDRARVREAVARTITDLESISIELRVIRSDGRVRVLDLHADPIVDQSGTPVRVIGVVHDITESKRAQEALSAASSNLAKYAAELQLLAAATDSRGDETPPHAPLSHRQLETLNLVAQGLTNSEIAKRMFVTEATVKWHIQQILAKTNSANRTEAVVRVLGSSAGSRTAH